MLLVAQVHVTTLEASEDVFDHSNIAFGATVMYDDLEYDVCQLCSYQSCHEFQHNVGFKRGNRGVAQPKVLPDRLRKTVHQKIEGRRRLAQTGRVTNTDE